MRLTKEREYAFNDPFIAWNVISPNEAVWNAINSSGAWSAISPSGAQVRSRGRKPPESRHS
jgi:hypothetical protein